ncbi:MAG: hypothetical protein COZ06_30860 [Armatimonadetes bacterium CG_4_10_14_3_um_filter_66_18]|nr:MAG: hypothetical protein COS65_14340 [Armatimonadetes bacterium CG06_land_8_20_14_3_00_66_21]PIX38031.1 MAG: hypothetical protein COZ57_31595 [Armatimonadetes bacterium CG_4_8_14_3_um_filter_66_20]PIY38645.1 MAG: hypothetical protein COZ06_30860 [Armatimonadetes bacterium CG_4_10_14_3_um_filter_66_18]
MPGSFWEFAPCRLTRQEVIHFTAANQDAGLPWRAPQGLQWHFAPTAAAVAERLMVQVPPDMPGG